MPKRKRFKKNIKQVPYESLTKLLFSEKLFKSSVPLLFILLFFTFLIYKNSLSNDFSYDDFSVVVENYYIKNPIYISSIFDSSYFTRFGENSYRPIVTLTYFADFYFWGLSSKGFHLTNIILHLSTLVLIFVFFERIFSEVSWPLFGTAVFAFHPLTTEAVNAVGFREDLLTTFFGLSSLLFFWNSLKTTPKGFQNVLFNQALSLLFFVFAVFSKESGMILILFYPATYLLACKNNKIKLKKTEIQFCLFLTFTFFGYVYIRFFLFKNPNPNTFEPIDFLTRVLTGVSVLGYYLKLLLFPFPLTVAYIFPKAIGWEIIRSIISLGLFLSISFWTWSSKNRKFLFGWFWFLIALIPTMNIYPIANPIAERYLYLPLVGGVLIFSEYLRLVLGKWKSNFPKLPIIFVILILSAYSSMVSSRNLDWRTSDTLWLKASKVSPMSSRALNGLGIFFMGKKDPKQAILAFKRALEINPNNIKALSNLGVIFHEEGQFKEAENLLVKALELNPQNNDTLTNLASTKIELMKFEEASDLLARSIKIEPFALEAHIVSGLLNIQIGNLKSALAFFLRAAEIRPDFKEPWNNIGALYGEMGNYVKSVEALKMALKVAPKDMNSNLNLAQAFYLLKDYENAKKYARISRSLGKTLPEFLSELLKNVDS